MVLFSLLTVLVLFSSHIVGNLAQPGTNIKPKIRSKSSKEYSLSGKTRYAQSKASSWIQSRNQFCHRYQNYDNASFYI